MTIRVRLSGYRPDEPWIAELQSSQDLEPFVEVVEEGADVHIHHPLRVRGVSPTVAFLDLRVDPHLVIHPDTPKTDGAVADAYAGDVASLKEALVWLADGGHHQETDGSSLIYLGSLGVASLQMAIGHRVRIDEPCFAGRGRGCQVSLRHGSHSDHNLSARRHARLTPCEGGLLVEDLGSTNGTHIDGQRITEPTLARPGQCVGFAGCIRFRVG